MYQHRFIQMVSNSSALNTDDLKELEQLVIDYPFFETAHLLYTKALQLHHSAHYAKQLRKTAILANSRSVLYDILQQTKESLVTIEQAPSIHSSLIAIKEEPPSKGSPAHEPAKPNTVTSTDDALKVIYVTTVPSTPFNATHKENNMAGQREIDIIKGIENNTIENTSVFSEEKLNQGIEAEITRGIIHSYVETDIIKTPDLHKTASTQPVSFIDWLNKLTKESSTLTIHTGKTEAPKEQVPFKNTEHDVKTGKKAPSLEQHKQMIDKIIETDPGKIKPVPGKFFTPSTDAKQSLLENEHLVTETLAKIYALQGNISKAIRAYEILSLKFPQKSAYFASLIKKLKTNT